MLEPTEKQLEQKFEQALKLFGWGPWVHFTAAPARGNSSKFYTHQRGHSGFPDYCITHAKHGGWLIELKTTKGRLSTGQKEWGESIQSAGWPYAVLRPANIDVFIDTALQGKEFNQST